MFVAIPSSLEKMLDQQLDLQDPQQHDYVLVQLGGVKLGKRIHSMLRAIAVLLLRA